MLSEPRARQGKPTEEAVLGQGVQMREAPMRELMEAESDA